jgi:hypothetical protein
MHFATPRQLTVLIVAWALLLLAYDQHANPKPFATYWTEFKGSSTRPTVVSEGDTPRVRLSMPHLCCKESVDEIRTALAPLAWLAPARLDREPPAKGNAAAVAADAMSAYDIDFDIKDLSKANFVALEQAVRKTGFVPDRIEISGMGHFRLEVELPHLCCTVCSRAVDDQLERLIRQGARGRWLDSMTLDHDKKTVLIYARLNAVVDLVELDTALGRAGFLPGAIRVLTGPES